MIGKWLSEGPIGFEAGDVNLSRYVTNQATMMIDSHGLDQGIGQGINTTGGDNVQYQNAQNTGGSDGGDGDASTGGVEIGFSESSELRPDIWALIRTGLKVFGVRRKGAEAAKKIDF